MPLASRCWFDVTGQKRRSNVVREKDRFYEDNGLEGYRLSFVNKRDRAAHSENIMSRVERHFIIKQTLTSLGSQLNVRPR